MSKETFQLLQRMDMAKVDVQLALQCAPVLAGLKVSNLFTVIYGEQAMDLHKALAGTGISVSLLSDWNRRYTYLLFRRELLIEYLRCPAVKEQLQAYGYDGMELDEQLTLLRERYQRYQERKEEFPHELGYFLGYPLEDVVGFIRHNGENYKCMGYWKVYSRPTEKQQIFAAYDKAKEEAIRFVSAGNRIANLLAV